MNKSLNILSEQSNQESFNTTQQDLSNETAAATCSNVNLPRSSKKRKLEDIIGVEGKKRNILFEGESELKETVKLEKKDKEDEDEDEDEEEEDSDYKKKTRKSVTEWTEKEVTKIFFLLLNKCEKYLRYYI